jgi:hypothetical protein
MVMTDEYNGMMRDLMPFYNLAGVGKEMRNEKWDYRGGKFT